MTWDGFPHLSMLRKPAPRSCSSHPGPSVCGHSHAPSLGLGTGTGSAGRWTWAKFKVWRRERALPSLQRSQTQTGAPLPVPDLLFLVFLALPSLCCLFFSFLPFLLTFLSAVLPKNFKVKMVTKTSVLLSWEFPENYNSPTPYKASAREESELCFFLFSCEFCLLV